MDITKRDALKLLGAGLLTGVVGGGSYLAYEWWKSAPTMHESSDFATFEEQSAVANGRNGILMLAKERWGYSEVPGSIMWGIDLDNQLLDEPTTPYEPNLAKTFFSRDKAWIFFNRNCFSGNEEQTIGIDFLPYLTAYQTTHAIALTRPERGLLAQGIGSLPVNTIIPYSSQGLNLTFAHKTEQGALPIVRNELTAALSAAISFINNGELVDISGIAPGLHNLRRFIDDCQVMHDARLSVLGTCLVNSDIATAARELCGISHNANLGEVQDHLLVSLIGALIEAGSAPNEDRYQNAIAKFNITCRAIKKYLETNHAGDLNEMTSQLSQYLLLIQDH